MNKILYFAKRGWADFFSPTRYRLADDVHSCELKEYYFVFDEDRLIKSHGYHFDALGIPQVRTHADLDELRYYYNPNFVGQYALAIYHTYLKTNAKADRARFIKLADWFLEHQERHLGNYVVWSTAVPVPRFNLHAPWISAMYQGRAASVLTRAYAMTQDRAYLELGIKAFDIFEVDVSRGGVRDQFNGHTFFEEYPSDPPCHVLNGMIFALFGLCDLQRIAPTDKTRALYQEGLKTIKAVIPLYDLGFWTKYDLYDFSQGEEKLNPSTVHYHYLHIDQLRLLHRITGDSFFARYAAEWAGYDKITNKLRAYMLKYKRLRTIAKEVPS